MTKQWDCPKCHRRNPGTLARCPVCKTKNPRKHRTAFDRQLHQTRSKGFKEGHGR